MILNLKGEVISDDWAELYRWFGYESGYFCPSDILAAMEALEPGEELLLQINSIGGDVEAAAEIYSCIASCKNPVRAEIQSIAASAASYFPLACDAVAISLPAQMMIHCASWSVGGNKFDHTWAAQQLEATDESILDTYCRKCGEHRREELRQLMEAETYLTAKQCLELGLVDSIIGEKAEDGTEEPLRMVASVQANTVRANTVRAMRTLPDIQELKAKKDTMLQSMEQELAAEMSRYA